MSSPFRPPWYGITKYSYSRFIRYQEGNRDADGFDLTKLGFPASYNSAIPADVRTFPQFNMTGYIPTASAAGENRPVMNHTLSSTLTKIRGTHSIRTGLEFRVYQENDKFFGFQQTGTFNFDSTWTRGPLDNAAGSPGSIGQSVAALLLGLPTSSSNVARTASYAEQSNSWGFFVQDDWKVTPKLTLNLGLRYEFEQPLHERYNRSVLGFDAYIRAAVLSGGSGRLRHALRWQKSRPRSLPPRADSRSQESTAIPAACTTLQRPSSCHASAWRTRSATTPCSAADSESSTVSWERGAAT